MEINECIGMKWVMSRLNMHPFISLYNGSFLYLVFQAKKTFFFIQAIIRIVGTAILSRKNIDCLFLAKC